MPIISKRKELLFKTLAVTFSLLISFLLAEGAYRLHLYRGFQRPGIRVINNSLYTYDEEYGYRYIPNATYVMAGIQHGQQGGVLYCWHGAVNEQGNIGIKNESWSADDFKILIVGDSFSSLPTGPNGAITWTDFFPGFLGEFGGRRVAVKNYARDGYGILQMFHLALEMARRHKPDLILVAFISDDLWRNRFYRSTTTIDKEERILTSPKPGNPPSLQSATDVMMLNPKVTAQWCRLPPDEQEEVLQELYSQYQRLSRSEIASDLKTLSTSLLYNRVVHRDPLYSSSRASRTPPLGYNDYRQDPVFMSDVRGLSELAIPLFLVHLPELDELRAGKYLMSSQEEHLMKSLEELTNSTVVSLLPLDEQPAQLEELFLLPYDYHLSERGATLYAKLIANSFTRIAPQSAAR